MRQLHEKETCVELLEGEILWFCGVVLGAASAADGVVNSNPSRASLDLRRSMSSMASAIKRGRC
jgi:hypothetical protein